MRPTLSAAADVPRETCVRPPRLPWLPEDIRRLKKLVDLKIARHEIAEILGREPGAVRSKISRLGWGKKYRKPLKWRRR